MFPSPLGASYFQITAMVYIIEKDKIRFRPLSGHLISKSYIQSYSKEWRLFPSPLGASYFQIVTFKRSIKDIQAIVSVPSRGILFPNLFFLLNIQYILCFRPLSGHLISKYCPPEPAILLAFLTLLRGKSFSCIFFLYLTYTIASKCSIYAVRGKIFFFSNEPLHTPILTHISHICIEI